MRRWVVSCLLVGGCSDFVDGATGTAASESSTSAEDASSTDGSGSTSTSATGNGTTTAVDPTNDSTSSATTDDPIDPTNDPTDADTETATTGGDPSGDTSTGDPPPEGECGNGIEEPGEECDDANEDQLDGCTDACGIGPLGLDFGAGSQTAFEGGGSSTGIQNAVDTCPQPQVLVGFSGGLTMGDNWIGVVRGQCQDGRLENADPPNFRTTGPLNALPERGQFQGGGPWQTQCGPNEAVIAVRGGAGDVMDGLQVECAELATVGDPGDYALSRSSTGWLDLQGSEGGGAFGPLRCPGNSVATGLETDTNSYVIRIRLLCTDIDLQYP